MTVEVADALIVCVVDGEVTIVGPVVAGTVVAVAVVVVIVVVVGVGVVVVAVVGVVEEVVVIVVAVAVVSVAVVVVEKEVLVVAEEFIAGSVDRITNDTCTVVSFRKLSSLLPIAPSSKRDQSTRPTIKQTTIRQTHAHTCMPPLSVRHASLQAHPASSQQQHPASSKSILSNAAAHDHRAHGEIPKRKCSLQINMSTGFEHATSAALVKCCRQGNVVPENLLSHARGKNGAAKQNSEVIVSQLLLAPQSDGRGVSFHDHLNRISRDYVVWHND
eukprot:m.511289 g.511289  ORF g.511289 m.511289 type:complete len:274 (+) comp21892_c1_seq10:2304-3125(+)